jgi:hypothetical protein
MIAPDTERRNEDNALMFAIEAKAYRDEAGTA